MKEEEITFKQAQADFRRLQKDHQLPPLMELKLALLKALVTKAPETHDIAQRLDHFEREALEQLPSQIQKRLFVDIIACLSGRESLTYCKDERVYLFREGKLFPWQKFYLTCTTNSFHLSPKRGSEQSCLKFECQRVSLSKEYKRYKTKEVFALDYDQLKYIFGFDDELACKRIHKLLSELIEQKRQWMVTKYDNLQYHNEMENGRMALPSHKINKIIEHEEYQYLLALEEKIKGANLVDDQGFKIYKNVAEGRVLVGSNGTVKSQFLVKGFTAEALATKYLLMTKWNPQIELFEVTGKPRRNCLTARLRTKKYSLISYQREALLAINFFRPCHCQDTEPSYQSYLLIEDLPVEEKPQGNAIRMSFRQTIGFLPNRDDPDLLLVVILTEAKFRGYSKDSDTLDMTLHFTEQIDKFLSFVYQRKQIPSGYLSEVPCPCGGNNGSQDVVTVTLPSQKWETEAPPDRLSLQSLTPNYQFPPKRVISTLQDVCNGLVNEQFLQLLKHRAHETYYLLHKFTPSDDCFPIYKEENSNFLKLGQKWQFKGEDLIFIDKEVLAVQKDILKMILKQLSTNFIQGKSIMNMSLPVEIFDKRSLLDAIADSYGFVARYAPQIRDTHDPVQQMKYMVCGFMFINATGPTIEKPFNPILGETYQGKIGDLPILLEQTSHHPPISTLLIKTPQLEISATIELVIDMGLNSANSYLCHWLEAKVLTTGTEYLIKLPELTMEGIVYGNRVVRAINKGFILEKKNNIFAQLSIGKTKKRVYECKQKISPADLVGGIFKVKQEFADKVLSRPKPKSFEGLKPQHIIETCSLLTGKWYGDLFFDGQSYKSWKEGPFPFKAQKLKYLLPSDSIWRQDLIYKIWKDNERSNRQKERLQLLQRNDRKLRQKYAKNKGK